jgi:hypothetical protein
VVSESHQHHRTEESLQITSENFLRYLPEYPEGNREGALNPLQKRSSLESIKHLIAQVDLAEADTAYRGPARKR